MSKIAAPPDSLRWSARSGDHGDCVVAAVEMACGVSYESALRAAVLAIPERDILSTGVFFTETPRILRRLGYSAKRYRAGRFDLDEATGILHVYEKRSLPNTSHAVYLWEGRIIEPMAGRRQMWRYPEQFLRHYHYKAGTLIAPVERNAT